MEQGRIWISPHVPFPTSSNLHFSFQFADWNVCSLAGKLIDSHSCWKKKNEEKKEEEEEEKKRKEEKIEEEKKMPRIFGLGSEEWREKALNYFLWYVIDFQTKVFISLESLDSNSLV